MGTDRVVFREGISFPEDGVEAGFLEIDRWLYFDASHQIIAVWRKGKEFKIPVSSIWYVVEEKGGLSVNALKKPYPLSL